MLGSGEECLPLACCDLRGTMGAWRHKVATGYKCGVWVPGVEQFEDAEVLMEVRNLCLRAPRKRHDVRLLGPAANTQHCMHVGLGQPAEALIQTI